MKFSRFCKYLDMLESTTKRLQMYETLAQMFHEADEKNIGQLIYLLQGQLKPPFYNIEIGISDKLLIKALSIAADVATKMIENIFKNTGDIGDTAIQVMSHRKGYGLSINEVYDELIAIAEKSGNKSVDIKLELIANLLRAASPMEAKHICRFITGRLRLGVGDPTVIEALSVSADSRAYKTDIEIAYNLCSDLGYVAKVLKSKGMEGVRNIDIMIGHPVRMMLCERVSSELEILQRMGMAAIDIKYDGMRIQCHKCDQTIDFFSRKLERTTEMFPELAEEIKYKLSPHNAIFEGEAVAYNDATGELLVFQQTIQRKRKHKIDIFAKELPLKFFVFDLLYLNGVNYINRPYEERKNMLNDLLLNVSEIIIPSQPIVTESPSEIKKYFENAISHGFEGIIAKKLNAPYTAGSRNFNWVKLKKSYKGGLSDSIDVCIVGYYRGKGSRRKFGLGGVLAAVYDKNTDVFYTVSKIGSGFTEDELSHLNKLLSAIALPQKPSNVISDLQPDVWVSPKYVITVLADEITRSPVHTAGRDAEGLGYALRFPRTEGFIREDKDAHDATTVDELIKMFHSQGKPL